MLQHIVARFKEHEKKVAEWFSVKIAGVEGDPVYCSVDVRNAGYKIAPVDTNIFPAGWNNLCPSYQREAGKLFQEYFKKNYPTARHVLILAEEHTRNPFYFESLFHLKKIVESAGSEVSVGTLNQSAETKAVFDTADGNAITIFKIRRENDALLTDSGKPDFVLVNNDFSAGIPELIKKIIQPLIPSPHIGWHQRKKSDHFKWYCDISRQLAEFIAIDPWLLCAEFTHVNDIDLQNQSDREKIAHAVDSIIEKIKPKHAEYAIKAEPFVFVKNDAGTYGMAVTTASSGDEFLTINKKTRNKLKTGKGNVRVSDFIIQEGIPTIDRFKGKVAEPVMYLVNHMVCGGFFRLHEERNERENLNTPGMQFAKLCFHEMFGYSNEYKGECDLECLSMILKHVARLASISAGHEIITVEASTTLP